MFSILVLYLSSPAVPKVLDILYPANETRGQIYLYQTEYFVDPDDYYLPILIHAYLTVPVSVGVIVFVDNMFAAYIHHACGMLRSLRTHLEGMHVVLKDGSTEEMKSQLIYEKIVSCATMHKNIITYVYNVQFKVRHSDFIIFVYFKVLSANWNHLGQWSTSSYCPLICL
uniref:Olfactory receptor 117 n=1 Tax=Aulacocentrum confusum TaxID=2767324 RepID=A0A7G8Z9D6_9HYME|nr:olfactory receptor 117 [Aulacocentrum confusum]